MKSKFKNALEKTVISSNGRIELVLVLSLILLLIHGYSAWYIHIPISILAVSAIAIPGLRYSSILWLLSFGILATGVVLSWYSLDNHKYLLAYWVLAVGISLTVQSPGECLRYSSRVMIGLVFLIAIVQKVKSGHYITGEFFHYKLLTDDRFEILTRFIGELSAQIHASNNNALYALLQFDSKLESVQLDSTLVNDYLSKLITWWSLILQTVIGVTFLFPNFIWFRQRDLFLLVFLFTTYMFAPVVGFGWVLAVMGIAQADKDKTYTVVMYLVSLVFLQIYQTPWLKVVNKLAALIS